MLLRIKLIPRFFILGLKSTRAIIETNHSSLMGIWIQYLDYVWRDSCDLL